jgi:integrase
MRIKLNALLAWLDNANCSSSSPLRTAVIKVSITVGNLSSDGTAIAACLNAKGVGMRTIQKLMGHRNIGTAALYCDVNDETIRNAVELV